MRACVCVCVNSRVRNNINDSRTFMQNCRRIEVVRSRRPTIFTLKVQLLYVVIDSCGDGIMFNYSPEN